MSLFREPSGKPPRLIDLKPGEQADLFVLLVSKDRGATRDGKPYFRLGFRDGTRQATTMIWSDSPFFADCEQNWQPGQCYKLRCRYTENQFGPQLDLDRIREAVESDRGDGFEPEAFFERSRFDPEEMFSELCELVRQHVEEPLQSLVLSLLDRFSTDIKRLPAASRNHHAYQAGYLEHTLSVVRTAVFLAEKYRAYYDRMQPPLSTSLVVAGATLHDIGKVQELEISPQGGNYTVEGRLIGHILLGRDLVREEAARIPGFPPEVLLRLEHIIVAHQNLPEWGSPVAPHTPEALLVHYADEIDAKFHMVAAVLEQPPTFADPFTSRENPLRRRIFRGTGNES